nr:pantetheine-phosphate adenylyltransferase [Cryptococcus depauperatus CBS 7855]
MISKIDLTDHTILILPFTPSLMKEASPYYSLILDILPKSASKSFTVFFSTPRNASTLEKISTLTATRQEEQFYSTLYRSPQSTFSTLQTFLGGIYSALWTAQWKCGRVLLDVEVHFEGEGGNYAEKLLRGTSDQEEYQVIKIDGVKETDLVTHINKIIPVPFKQLSIPSPALSQPSVGSYEPSPALPGFPVVALGGTFDRLHAAHKLLLHLGYFLSARKLIVGIMADDLLGSKIHADLVQPLEVRLAGVVSYLQRLGEQGRIELNVLEIHDSLGPTRTSVDIGALVVSRETLSGGEYINNVRRESGLGELELFVVDVIAGMDEIDLKSETDEEKLKKLKMGSTGVRKWIEKNGSGQQNEKKPET